MSSRPSYLYNMRSSKFRPSSASPEERKIRPTCDPIRPYTPVLQPRPRKTSHRVLQKTSTPSHRGQRVLLFILRQGSNCRPQHRTTPLCDRQFLPLRGEKIHMLLQKYRALPLRARRQRREAAARGPRCKSYNTTQGYHRGAPKNR